MGIGILNEGTEHIVVDDEILGITNSHRDPHRFGAGLDHGQGLGMAGVGHEKGVPFTAPLDAMGHGHGFSRGG